jgi:hypothetical protein
MRRVPTASRWPTFNEVYEVLAGDETVKDNIDDLAVYLQDKYPDLPASEAAQQAKEAYKDEFVTEYQKVADYLRHSAQGKDCWRAMRLPTGLAADRLEQLGIYWADTEGAAIAHWGNQGRPVVFRAKIDLKYVDLLSMITTRLLFPDEREVTFIKHSPIYVYDVTEKNGDVFAINDWRTC